MSGISKEAFAIASGEPLPRDQQLQLGWAMTLALTAEPAVGQRQNMPETFAFIRENPTQTLRLLQDLDAAAQSLNYMTQTDDIPDSAHHIRELQPVLKDCPLPSVFERTSNEDFMLYQATYQNALTTANRYMAVREIVEDSSDLPPDILESNEWIEGHIRAKAPEERIAALMMHGYDLVITQLPEYKDDIPLELVVNALCESLALNHRDSQLFKLLFDPEGLDWYAEGYGLSSEFLSFLKSEIAKDTSSES